MMTNKKTLALVLVLALLTGALVAAVLVYRSNDGDGGDPERKSRAIYGYFDTVAVVYDYSGDSNEAFLANLQAFEDELSLCHKLFDIYNEYDGTANIATVNKGAGNGVPVKVDPRIIELLLFSLEMHERTDGAVNVAMGAVLSIWHEYRTKGVSVPDFEVLNAASEHCDISKLIIDKDASTVYLADPEMSLDVGAVAKGFAIDCAVKRLKDRGVSSYAVDVGGNLYAIGKKPSGEPLKTGIQNPLGGDYSAVIEIADGSVATSGDYQRYYTVNGVRYHHIIHPDTLYPADIHRSVSVYSSSAALSDALSTALFNMNEEHGKALVEKEFPSVRALVYVGDDGIGRTVRFCS